MNERSDSQCGAALTPGLLPVDAAAVLATTPKTLADWRYRGKGPPFIKFGKKVVYRPEDLQRFIDEHRCVSTAVIRSA